MQCVNVILDWGRNVYEIAYLSSQFPMIIQCLGETTTVHIRMRKKLMVKMLKFFYVLSINVCKKIYNN